MKMRGRVMAGPLPITMGLFGTLITILTSVGGIMVVQTGIVKEVQYTCTEVSTAELLRNISVASDGDNGTASPFCAVEMLFDHFQLLVPDPTAIGGSLM